MQEKFLEGIYYRKSYFSKKKKTLFLIHGLSSSSSAWLPYERELSKKYNLIIPDLRGHGKSFRPKRYKDYAITKISEDLYKILKNEKINKFVIVGHSFANLVLLDFLEKHQNIVEKVIFINPDYVPDKRMGTRVIRRLLFFMPFFDYFPNKKIGGHIDYKNYIETGDWNLRRLFVDIKNTGFKSYLNFSRQAGYFSAENFLKKIKMPTLIIGGKIDSIFPIKCAEDMSKIIKNSKLVIIEKADHLIVLNWEKRLIKEINDFLDK
jgi:pimeloyl-ACP methyl ester carboxylesterase